MDKQKWYQINLWISYNTNDFLLKSYTLSAYTPMLGLCVIIRTALYLLIFNKVSMIFPSVIKDFITRIQESACSTTDSASPL